MIDDSVIVVLNGLLKVILYSMYLASPLIILILLMYGYERYKKWKAKEFREAERIIVKMNEDIRKDALVCDTLKNKKTELHIEVDALRKEREQLRIDLGKPEDVVIEEKQDITQLNIKDLKALAKQRAIPRYSKMNKTQLLEILGA